MSRSTSRGQYHTVGVTASVVVGAASAVALNYSDSCLDGEGGKHSWFLGQEGVGNPVCFSTDNSNTIAALSAICLYCVPTGIIYHIQHQKRYVDVFLVCGITLGLVAGFATGFGPREMLFRLLPGLALGALVVSLLGPDVEMKAKDDAKIIPQ